MRVTFPEKNQTISYTLSKELILIFLRSMSCHSFGKILCKMKRGLLPHCRPEAVSPTVDTATCVSNKEVLIHLGHTFLF